MSLRLQSHRIPTEIDVHDKLDIKDDNILLEIAVNIFGSLAKKLDDWEWL